MLDFPNLTSVLHALIQKVNNLKIEPIDDARFNCLCFGIESRDHERPINRLQSGIGERPLIEFDDLSKHCRFIGTTITHDTLVQ